MHLCEKMPTENSTCASRFVSWHPCRQGVETCQRGCTSERMGPNWTPLLVRIDQPWTKSASLPGGTRPDTPHHMMQTCLCTPRISWAVCTNGAVAGRRIGLSTGERSVLNAPGALS